jgi:hypothetical protein
VNTSQLQMKIAGYCHIINDMSLHNSYISYGTSDTHNAYLHKLFLVSYLCLRDCGLSSEKWHMAIVLWFIIDACCESIVCGLWVFIAACSMVTNWSSLNIAYKIDESMCKQTLTCLLKFKWFVVVNPYVAYV